MAADPIKKLAIYNAALGHIGERKLASLTEARESRRVLDDYYNDVVAHCLEMGSWTFVKREKEISASTSVTPDFGFTHSFPKPTDWVRTIAISASEFFTPPLLHFTELNGYWQADCDPIYVRYVSNDPTFGGLDQSRWSQLFEDYVILRLAAQICTRISGAESRKADLRKEERKALAAAREHDGANLPPQFQPTGTWVNSRGRGRNTSRWDRRS